MKGFIAEHFQVNGAECEHLKGDKPHPLEHAVEDALSTAEKLKL